MCICSYIINIYLQINSYRNSLRISASHITENVTGITFIKNGTDYTLTLQSKVQPIRTTCFNMNTYHKLCPHNSFVCFAWFVRTRNEYLVNNPQRLIFVTETQCVFAFRNFKYYWAILYDSNTQLQTPRYDKKYWTRMSLTSMSPVCKNLTTAITVNSRVWFQ